MYDLSELGPTNKEIAALILIVFIILVACFGAGYLLGVERTEDIYHNGSGAGGVEQQITEAGSNIQDAKDGIEAAAGTADQIGAGIGQAKESAGYIQHTADTSAELIAECESIIRSVRQRGQADTAPH